MKLNRHRRYPQSFVRRALRACGEFLGFVGILTGAVVAGVAVLAIALRCLHRVDGMDVSNRADRADQINLTRCPVALAVKTDLTWRNFARELAEEVYGMKREDVPDDIQTKFENLVNRLCEDIDEMSDEEIEKEIRACYGDPHLVSEHTRQLIAEAVEAAGSGGSERCTSSEC